MMILPVALVLAVLGGILALAVVACALTTSLGSPAPTATPASIDVVVVPQAAASSATPSLADFALTLTASAPPVVATPLTAQPVVTTFATQSIAQTTIVSQQPEYTIPAGCAVRADWTAYTVLAGDTVGGLAIATNTPVVEIVVGNCLQNPDIIQAGQVLYLPRLPQTTTATIVVNAGPEQAASATIGFLTVEPAVVQSGAYLIRTGDITVRAHGVGNAWRVTFFTAPTGTDAAPVVLGMDDNLTDGAGLIWRVSYPITANVWATATGPDGIDVATDPILVVNNG